MDNTRIIYLAQKIVDGNITAAELEEFNHWYYSNDGESYSVKSHDSIDELATDMFRQVSHRAGINVKRHRSPPLWPRIAVAAAVSIMVFGGGLFYYNRTKLPSQTSQIADINDIAPGKKGATLTLANGKEIRLSDAANGELAKEAGVVITKTSTGQLVYEIKGAESAPNKTNTLSTAAGETYQVRLPDGSLVYLNAASSLTYSTSLNRQGGARRVKLSGEGYFEVARDKAHPFIVESPGQQVEVLGTHFNINSYADEPAVKTTLLEGSVRVKASGGAIEKVLKPSQQSILYAGKINVAKADIEEVTAWKNGLFIFNDEPISDIMRRVARWYNVKIVYKDVDRKELFGGGISRYENISKVLTKLEKTGGVHFRLEGNTVYVSR